MDEDTLNSIKNPDEPGVYNSDQINSLVSAYETTAKQFADYQSTATAKVTTLETENAKYVEENLKLKAANFDLISKQPANIEQKQDEPTIKTISDLFEEK